MARGGGLTPREVPYFGSERVSTEYGTLRALRKGMYVGMARYDFVVPGSHSLKDKRQVLKRIVGGARSKFNVAIAEVDHQDLRQRAAIAVSCVSESSFHAKKMLHEVERYVRGHYDIEVLDAYIEVMTPDA